MKSLKETIYESRSIEADDMSVYLEQYTMHEYPEMKQWEDFEHISIDYSNNHLTVFVQLPCGKGYSSHYREVRIPFTLKNFSYVTKEKISDKYEQKLVEKVNFAVADYFANRGIKFVKEYEMILQQELD